jgi:hypothetical protein
VIDPLELIFLVGVEMRGMHHHGVMSSVHRAIGVLTEEFDGARQEERVDRSLQVLRILVVAVNRTDECALVAQVRPIINSSGQPVKVVEVAGA